MNPSQETLSSISKLKKNHDYKNNGENISYTSNDIILLNTAMKNLMKNKRVLEAKLANKRVIESKRVSTTQCYLRRKKFQTSPSRLSVMPTIKEEDEEEDDLRVSLKCSIMSTAEEDPSKATLSSISQ